jgi:divalent anion:Na+ symporter, DASS family
MNMTPAHNQAANELYTLLSPELRAQLASHERCLTVPAGTQLITQGVPPDQLVIVNSGKVEITLACSGESVSLDCAEAGKVFGMRAAISGELPEINVTCVDSCNITTVPRDVFLGLLKAHPETYFAVARVLSGDLQIADRILRNSARRGSPGQRRMSKPV